jgi:ribosomal-protein-alanine N-acetyltransferase
MGDHSFFIAPMVTINTQRLRLREFNLGDAAAVFEYGRRMEVARYAGWGPYETIEEVEHLLQRFSGWQFDRPRRRLVLAMTLQAGGPVMGDIGLSTRNEEAAEAELGYALHPDYWGKGIASEAAAAMVAYGFGVVGWQRIFATCYVENEASAAVLGKIGMKQERVLPQHAQRHGRWYDALLFAISRAEWEMS